ncbi:MAG: TauD/TfdA family dioxygenase [Pseudomonadota bacterium]
MRQNQIETIQSPAAWHSQQLYDATDRWQYYVTQSDIEEIDNALAHLKSCHPDSYRIHKHDFPLSRLATKLENIAEEVENGLGIFLLRGVPLSRYNQDDLKLVYAGLIAYIGVPVPQSKAGELIGDVGDTGKKLTDKTARGTTSRDPLPFHTDRSDVVTLFCLQQSATGGASRVVSAIAIHNEIAKSRPDLLQLLYQPYYYARVHWETDKKDDYYPLPIFSNYHGCFAIRYLRYFINLSQEIDSVPKMSHEQIEALNLVERLANDPNLCADMDFEPGDIQILNNFVSLHSRAGYENSEKKRRHLLRMWLSAHNNRPLSPDFKPLFGETKQGVIRGGVPVSIKKIEK